MSLLTDHEKAEISKLAQTTIFSTKDLKDAYLLPKKELRCLKVLKTACQIASAKGTSVIDENWRLISLIATLEKRTFAYRVKRVKEAFLNLWVEIKILFLGLFKKRQ